MIIIVTSRPSYSVCLTPRGKLSGTCKKLMSSQLQVRENSFSRVQIRTFATIANILLEFILTQTPVRTMSQQPLSRLTLITQVSSKWGNHRERLLTKEQRASSSSLLMRSQSSPWSRHTNSAQLILTSA